MTDNAKSPCELAAADGSALLHALKLALPCVEYAEICTAAEGHTAAHDKCLTALEWMRPLLAQNGRGQ